MASSVSKFVLGPSLENDEFFCHAVDLFRFARAWMRFWMRRSCGKLSLGLLRLLAFGEMRAALHFLCCIIVFLGKCFAEQSENDASKQAANGVNYADVRARLAKSLPEKANEIADLIDTLQEISQATTEVAGKISAHCTQ